MKKHVLALLLSAAALVTFTATPLAQRWGWSELAGPTAWVSASKPTVPVTDIGAYVGEAAAVGVKVVPLDVDPAALRAPGILAEALPALDEALAAIRMVVAEDPVLVTNLKARGLDAHNVVGLTHSPDGITLFVSNA
jgi:hypothetical protein